MAANARRGRERPVWPGLDALRAFAVAAVVLFHAGYAARGFLGVDVFFVLSGFLITTLLVGEWNATGGIHLRLFYARRILRLYPALVVTVLFCVSVAVAVNRSVAATAHDATASALYFANLVHLDSGLLDHTWTLALEEQFYLVWPLLLMLCLRARRPWAYAVAILPYLALLAADFATGRATALHTYTRAAGLPLGCALAYAGPRWWRLIGVAGAPAGVAVVVLAFVHTPSWVLEGWPASVAAALSVPIVSWIVTGELSVLRNDILLWAGRRSYAIYLWHFPLLSLTLHHSPVQLPHVVRVLIAVTATVAISALSYRLIEVRFLRRKAQLRPPRYSTGSSRELSR